VKHERALKRDDLILPIYYIDAAEFERGSDKKAAAAFASLLERQYYDWRELRVLPFSNSRVRRGVVDLAGEIRNAIARTRKGTSVPRAVAAQSRPQGLPLQAPSGRGEPISGVTPDEEVIEYEPKVAISTKWERESGFPIADYWPDGSAELFVTNYRVIVRDHAGLVRDLALNDITVTALMANRIEIYPSDQTKTFRIEGPSKHRLAVIESAVSQTPGGWRNPAR
jgi:hypothetical protein